jgi:hypothetical protein
MRKLAGWLGPQNGRKGNGKRFSFGSENGLDLLNEILERGQGGMS